jgi:uncharacterized protein YxjI
MMRRPYGRRRPVLRDAAVAGATEASTRYLMRQRLVALGDDFDIKNGAGQVVFRVDGKALRVRETLVLRDAHGTELFGIEARVLTIGDTLAIQHPHGQVVARVHQALIEPLRARFEIEVAHGEDMHAQGNVLDHEYRIERDSGLVAEVSKRWFTLGDSYGVEVLPGHDDGLVLAIVLCIDALHHAGR